LNEQQFMSDKKVQDWMHRGVITCRPETSVAEVAAILDEHDISALVVTNEQGDAAGVISRTDLVNARFVQPYMKHWRGLNAEHLMTKPVVSVAGETSINEAVVEKHGGHILPVGILSITDLARHAREDPKSEE
jgi:CBS domain-containing protein